MKLIFMFGILFMISLQPIFMISMLIIISIMYSYMIYETIGTYWFSYILLMVMLSGVLVVFTYMVTLSPNEGFEMFSLVIMLMFMLIMIMNYNYFYTIDYSLISVALWITYLGIMSLFMVSFLLTIMLMVIALSYINEGAFHVN